jgi:hypothetical protein
MCACLASYWFVADVVYRHTADLPLPRGSSLVSSSYAKLRSFPSSRLSPTQGVLMRWCDGAFHYATSALRRDFLRGVWFDSKAGCPREKTMGDGDFRNSEYIFFCFGIVGMDARTLSRLHLEGWRATLASFGLQAPGASWSCEQVMNSSLLGSANRPPVNRILCPHPLVIFCSSFMATDVM